jgi:hypothetical protein
MGETMADFLDLPVEVNGNIFRVNSAFYVVNSGGITGQPSLTFRVNNISGNWIDAVVERDAGETTTGHINHGESSEFTEALGIYVNRNNKITRWRPGVFGIPGNGGGEVYFNVPEVAEAVSIEVSITG